MGDFVNIQDHKEVILRKNTKPTNGSGANGASSGKVRVEITKQQKELLSDSGETPAIKYFGAENAKILQAARLAKSMTQQQLANSINEKSQVINAYENGGKVVPDHNILNKLRRVLNVKFV